MVTEGKTGAVSDTGEAAKAADFGWSRTSKFVRISLYRHCDITGSECPVVDRQTAVCQRKLI
jgi:hypothetical protein